MAQPLPPALSPAGRGAPSFDAQAERFDRRAGLPPAVEEAVARRVLALPHRLDTGDLVVDLGAGTGEIGHPLATAAGALGLTYVGLDLSPAMLGRFARKLRKGEGRSRSLLVAADGDAPWPLVPGRARILFSSRAAHLLRPEHLIAEAFRIAAPGGAWLVLGRVRRERGSVRQALRRRLHELLAGRGIAARGGEELGRHLFELARERGARPLPAERATSWEVTERAGDSLASWRSKAGLAGRSVEPHVQNEVLDELEEWARGLYGDLATPHSTREHYEITALTITPPP